MSYYPKKSRPTAMGDISSVVTNILNGVSGVIGKAAEFGADPYAPELVCRVGQLAAIKSNRPVPGCVAAPLDQNDTIGLRKIMLPLRGYVYAEQHPWAYPVAAVAILGLPFLLGYYLGKD